MMYYPGDTIRLTAEFRATSTNALTNPDTASVEVMDPSGTIATYTYGVDAEIGRTSTGFYYCDVVPAVGGRHHYRWSVTGATSTSKGEGFIPVQASPFVDGIGPRAYGR